MLVLSRKIGEKIIIGKDIVLEVLRVDGNTVRIGIVAPKEVLVRREEIPQEWLENRKPKSE